MALQKGIRLDGPGQIPPNLSPTYTNTSSALSGPRLASKPGKITTGPQVSFATLCGTSLT